MEKTTPLEKDKVLEKIKKGEVKIGKKSIIQAEGEAHNEDVEKLDKTVEEVEVKPEKPKRKAKPKTETPKEVFPVDARINDYNFLHLKTGWLADLGWTKGMALRIDKNPDGSITLRKA
jgi:hypothetical protein